MDDIALLKLEIGRSVSLLSRINATAAPTNLDRRYATILEDSVALKQKALRQLERQAMRDARARAAPSRP